MNITGEISQVEYRCTNESLAAIVNGLDVNKNDDILAVCGSGDQAFALLENAHSVAAVDIDDSQIAYAEYRKKCLKEGRDSAFLYYTGMEFMENRNYLSCICLAKIAHF